MFDDNVAERYALAIERISQINNDCEIKNKSHADYFNKVSAFIMLMDRLKTDVENKAFDDMSLEELDEYNNSLYADVACEAYDKSYANPRVCAKAFGEDTGKLMAMVYMELRGLIVYMYEKRLADAVAVMELFIEIYCIFVDAQADSIDIVTDEQYRQLGEAVYWYVSDYSDDFIEYRIRELLDPSLDFATRIIMESDLSDVRYLYKYGEYVTENEIKMAKHLNTLSEEAINDMARTFTEGYRIGFAATGKDLSKKTTAQVRYPIGFERMVRAAVKNLEKLNLKVTMRACSSAANKQYDYDHKEDKALYYDKAYVERRLEVMKTSFEEMKKLANGQAGPAVIEVFGEIPFSPETKKEVLKLDEKQQQLSVYDMSMSGQITNQYIIGEERSFTIIAYPVPEIGEKFEEIFAETVKINTLDYTLYQNMQQKIIDVLDQAEKVHITGKNGNKTDLYVSIWPLKDATKESAFENCVADVNIPVGEVFTSPVLKGTTGKLFVSQVYLNELKYLNLEIDFEDGMIRDYTCTNFEKEEECRKYIKENVLMNHETLPMGEFAIGTNTTAYRMARDFDIADKLPILIAEKTGPHFAVGDTCYSHEEDMVTYNPDGKQIVARENDFSKLRSEDMSKAYFNCHTDITIPYDELDKITVIRKDGTTEDIISDGRFVLAGIEELNKPLDR